MTRTAVLDDPARIAAVDVSGMLGVIEGWAEQWERAMASADAIPAIAGPLESIVVCGMGGSGIAGDIVRGLFEPHIALPIRLVRGHTLPGFAGATTLVICLSYSGNTTETIACFDEAIARGCTVAVISAGGTLAARARAAGATLYDDLPAGLMPRSALASLVVPLAVTLGRAGLIDPSGILAAGLDVARECVAAWRSDVPAERNKAKQIAAAIGERLPVVWGSEGTQTIAALRWKAQLSENAKLPAVASMLPELCHNDIVGLHHGHPAMREAVLLALRVEGGHPGQETRLRAALEIAGSSMGSVEVVTIESRSPDRRLIESLVLADFVSVYTAIARGVDPTPIEAIRLLKAAIA